MTRHGSTRTRPPYQATTISQTATQLQQSALQRLRNPWVPGDCQSTTNSSSSSRTYHGIPSDGLSSPIYHSPLPEEQMHFDNTSDSYDNRNNLIGFDSYSNDFQERRKKSSNDTNTRQYYRNDVDSFPNRVYPEDGPERRYFNNENDILYHNNRYQEVDRQTKDRIYPTAARNFLDDHGRLAYQQPMFNSVTTSQLPGVHRTGNLGRQLVSITASASDRAQSPGSLTGRGAVDGCGGHCIAFQNFCYYFLQVLFVIGILTGISLCIEGSAVRRNRGKDLSVLVYIGCLISMVCTLLLCIQYCVRRNVERRKKALRLALNAIPMSDIPLEPSPVTLVPTASTRHHHQFNMPDSRSGYHRDTFRSGMSTVPFMSHGSSELPDQNGIPWWRRDPVRH